MNTTEYKNDDRFGTLTADDIGCRGSKGEAVAWLLDPANSTAVCAVLDEDDMTVATSRNGEIVWTELADFNA